MTGLGALFEDLEGSRMKSDDRSSLGNSGNTDLRVEDSEICKQKVHQRNISLVQDRLLDAVS